MSDINAKEQSGYILITTMVRHRNLPLRQKTSYETIYDSNKVRIPKKPKILHDNSFPRWSILQSLEVMAQHGMVGGDADASLLFIERKSPMVGTCKGRLA